MLRVNAVNLETVTHTHTRLLSDSIEQVPKTIKNGIKWI